MKAFLKEHGFHLLFATAAGLVGGWFTGIYAAETLAPALQEEVLSTLGSLELLYAVSALQAAGYALVLGAVGILLAKKLGLWRPITLQRKGVTAAAATALAGGALIMALDLLVFAPQSQWIADSYAVKPNAAVWLASILYGGVVEEIMLRLFLLSLIALLLWKLFARAADTAPTWCIVTANILSAMLFAAGHLPSTALATALSPVIIVRCFLCNGSLALVFGRLYRLHGIQYAMLAHAGCHIVMKTIWMML